MKFKKAIKSFKIFNFKDIENNLFEMAKKGCASAGMVLIFGGSYQVNGILSCCKHLYCLN